MITIIAQIIQDHAAVNATDARDAAEQIIATLTDRGAFTPPCDLHDLRLHTTGGISALVEAAAEWSGGRHGSALADFLLNRADIMRNTLPRSTVHGDCAQCAAQP